MSGSKRTKREYKRFKETTQEHFLLTVFPSLQLDA